MIFDLLSNIIAIFIGAILLFFIKIEYDPYEKRGNIIWGLIAIAFIIIGVLGILT